MEPDKRVAILKAIVSDKNARDHHDQSRPNLTFFSFLSISSHKGWMTHVRAMFSESSSSSRSLKKNLFLVIRTPISAPTHNWRRPNDTNFIIDERVEWYSPFNILLFFIIAISSGSSLILFILAWWPESEITTQFDRTTTNIRPETSICPLYRRHDFILLEWRRFFKFSIFSRPRARKKQLEFVSNLL
jgi:hypothetical protein